MHRGKQKRQTYTHRWNNTEEGKRTNTYRWTNQHTDRHANQHTDRRTNQNIDRHANQHTNRQTITPTGRRASTQTGSRAHRQAAGEQSDKRNLSEPLEVLSHRAQTIISDPQTGYVNTRTGNKIPVHCSVVSRKWIHANATDNFWHRKTMIFII